MDNKKVNQLVTEFKKTGDQRLSNEIYKLLSNVVTEKAKYVFYRKTIKRGKKTLNLKDTGLLELNDVVNYLWRDVFELIKKHDINKPFDVYFYSTLWHWNGEKFINRDFLQQMSTDLECELITDDNINPLDVVAQEDNVDINFERLDEREQRIVEEYAINRDITHEELANKLSLTRERVTQIIGEIREKIKKYNLHI